MQLFCCGAYLSGAPLRCACSGLSILQVSKGQQRRGTLPASLSCESDSASMYFGRKTSAVGSKRNEKITLAKYEFVLENWPKKLNNKKNHEGFTLKNSFLDTENIRILSIANDLNIPITTTKIRTISPHWNWSDLDAVGSPCWQARLNLYARPGGFAKIPG